MNPFTRFLQQWSRDRSLAEFAHYWEALEALVVAVYRQKLTPVAAQPEFERVWPWLRSAYDRWEARLRPHWQQTRAGGEPTRVDPFRLLLDIEETAAIVGDWRIMQHLPAAREALNRLILEESD